MSSWKISLFGKFGLFSASGEEVKLASRKVEGLLAMLVVAGQCGLDRDEIVGALWPGSSSVQNLRQAVFHLRQAIGSNCLDLSTTHCRLTEEFVYAGDLTDPSLRNSDCFMPGHAGEWFDRTRIEIDVAKGEGAGALLMDGFVQTLEWYARHNPKALFPLMKETHPMVRGVPHKQLLHVLDLAERQSVSDVGYSSYWRGKIEDNLGQCAVLLNRALKEAKACDDFNLGSETCFELGKVYSGMGEVNKALAVCALAKELSPKGGPFARANYHLLAGTILVQWGQFDIGLARLLTAEEFIEDPLEMAVAKSRRSDMQAAVGLNDEARLAMEQSIEVTNGIGHERVDICVDLTRGILAFNERRFDEAERILLRMSRVNFLQLRVYAEEMLAILQRDGGDATQARTRMTRVKADRRSNRMAMNPLDQHRLQILTPVRRSSGISLAK